MAGEPEAGIALMREAVELESATPKHAVTPAPTLPAYELLGDLLLDQQRPVDALEAYEQSLERYPRRFNSLLGAARAARLSGNASAARGFYRDLLDVAADESRRPALEEARAFVAERE
jgi:tetratricopeptide (TPR) repeat protein